MKEIRDLRNLNIENDKFVLNLKGYDLPIYCNTIGYKKSCLKDKSVIFYDSNIEVGMKSQLIGVE